MTNHYPLVTIPSRIYVPVVEDDGELVKLNQWSEQPDNRYEYCLQFYPAGGLRRVNPSTKQVSFTESPDSVVLGGGPASRTYDPDHEHALRITIDGGVYRVEARGQWRRLVYDALRNNPIGLVEVEDIINQIRQQQ